MAPLEKRAVHSDGSRVLPPVGHPVLQQLEPKKIRFWFIPKYYSVPEKALLCFHLGHFGPLFGRPSNLTFPKFYSRITNLSTRSFRRRRNWHFKCSSSVPVFVIKNLEGVWSPVAATGHDQPASYPAHPGPPTPRLLQTPHLEEDSLVNWQWFLFGKMLLWISNRFFFILLPHLND